VLTSILSFLVLGTVLGVVYVLFSEGFSLLYGVAGVLNGAYGALYMVVDYAVFLFFFYLKLGAVASILLSLAFVAAVAFLAQKYVASRGRSPLEALFITLAFAFVLQYSVQFLQCSSAFPESCQYPAFVPVFITGSTSILGVSVFNQYVIADLVSVVVLVSVWLLLSRTRTGKGIRAVSQDHMAASLVGINPERAILITSLLAAVMAGTSSVFLASYQTVDPTIGWSVLTLAFAIVVIGGLGSLVGTVVASFILAFIRTYILLFVNPLLADFVSLALLIVVLLIRPQGIFGREVS
jgi:branched-chain amino acid transport system permease protein